MLSVFRGVWRFSVSTGLGLAGYVRVVDRFCSWGFSLPFVGCWLGASLHGGWAGVSLLLAWVHVGDRAFCGLILAGVASGARVLFWWLPARFQLCVWRQRTRRLEHLTAFTGHWLGGWFTPMLGGVQWISVKHGLGISWTISCASALMVVKLYAWLMSHNHYLKCQPCMLWVQTMQLFNHHADWQPVNLGKTLPWTQLDNFLYVSTGRHQIVSTTNVAQRWYQSFTIALRHVNPVAQLALGKHPTASPISCAYLIIT